MLKLQHGKNEIKENAELLALKADDLESIKEHFGITEQVKKLKEELLELTDELDKSLKPTTDAISLDRNISALISELADVQICIAQVAGSIGGEKFRKIFLNKISRTKIRIKSGYYDADSSSIDVGAVS